MGALRKRRRNQDVDHLVVGRSHGEIRSCGGDENCPVVKRDAAGDGRRRQPRDTAFDLEGGGGSVIDEPHAIDCGYGSAICGEEGRNRACGGEGQSQKTLWAVLHDIQGSTR